MISIQMDILEREKRKEKWKKKWSSSGNLALAISSFQYTDLPPTPNFSTFSCDLMSKKIAIDLLVLVMLKKSMF